MAKKFNISLSIGNNITNEKDNIIYVEPSAAEQELDEHIAQVDAGRAVAKEKFEALKERVTSNETNISIVTTKVEELQEEIDGSESSSQESITDLTNKINSVGNRVSIVELNVDAAAGKAAQNASAIEQININADAASAILETISVKANKNESDLVSLTAIVNQNKADKSEIPSIAGLASEEYVNESVSSGVEAVQNKINLLVDTVESMRAYIDLLHTENPNADRTQLVYSSVDKTPYTVPASAAATDVSIDIPLFNKVNVTAENVNITSNITAEEVAPSGITIKATDTVAIGE